MSNFESKLKKKMEEKGLSKSSIELYLKNVKKLNDDKPILNFAFLKDIENIKKKLEKYKPNTIRNYYISISSVLSLAGDSYKKLHQEYHNKMMELNKDLNKKEKMEVKTDEQKKNWISQEEVKNTLDDLKQKVEKFKNDKKITKYEYDTLLNYLVLALYVLNPPRRNKDYQIMMMFRNYKDDLNENYNYLDVDNKQFIFRNYKTEKTHGEQIIPINDDLMSIINLYIKHYPQKLNKKFYVPFLVNYKGEPLTKINDITNILNKIFDKKIGSSMLRKIYLTEKYSDVKKESKKDAELMAHSQSVQMNNYVKVH